MIKRNGLAEKTIEGDSGKRGIWKSVGGIYEKIKTNKQTGNCFGTEQAGNKIRPNSFSFYNLSFNAPPVCQLLNLSSIVIYNYLPTSAEDFHLIPLHSP